MFKKGTVFDGKPISSYS